MNTPIIVSRFDVAMEPAIEEEQILTIGAVAEDGRPVALLLDPETRRKVGGWLVPTPVKVLGDAANELHEMWLKTSDDKQAAGLALAMLRIRDMALAASAQDEKDTREGEFTPQPDELVIYRAVNTEDELLLGTYTNAAAARAHCKATVSDQHPADVALLFGWIGDEDDPEEPSELVVEIDGDEQATGYAVYPLTVASEYDPEADA
jgi:hypothetical protein